MEVFPQNQIFEELFKDFFPHLCNAMKVKELRDRLNMSQQELSDATGIPKDRIAKWEQGKGSPKTKDSEILNKFVKEHVPLERIYGH